jgi:hypothetical protein
VETLVIRSPQNNFDILIRESFFYSIHTFTVLQRHLKGQTATAKVRVGDFISAPRIFNLS